MFQNLVNIEIAHTFQLQKIDNFKHFFKYDYFKQTFSNFKHNDHMFSHIYFKNMQKERKDNTGGYE